MDRQQETNEIEELQAFLDRARPYFGTEREKTFFEVGMRGHYENPTTELLQFFIDPQNQHGLGDAFYRGLLSALELDEAECGAVLSVDTEVVTASGGRIDLLISTDSCIIAIECKIYHLQVNPFEEYVEHVRKLCQDNGKQPIYMILCIDGNSSQSEWTGVPYRNLVECTKSFLAESLLGNPLNKWGVLARDFLMHLARFGESPMNDEQFDLIKNNIINISKLKELERRFSDEVVQRVIRESGCNNVFGKTSRTGEVNIRFRYSNWESNDDVMLYHDAAGGESCFTVIAFIENPSPDLVEAFRYQLDSIDMGAAVESYREAGWWGCTWKGQQIETAITLVSNSLKALDIVGRIRLKSARLS